MTQLNKEQLLRNYELAKALGLGRHSVSKFARAGCPVFITKEGTRPLFLLSAAKRWLREQRALGRLSPKMLCYLGDNIEG